MLSPPPKLYEIVEEYQFTDELRGFEPNPIRADEFVDGAKFVLSRNPEYGTHIAKNVWFLPMWGLVEGRSLILYYTFDANRVIFLSLQLASEEATEE